MEFVAAKSELEAQHQLYAPRRAGPNGSGVQYVGDDSETGGRRDTGPRIGEDRVVEQVKRLGSELHVHLFRDGRLLLECRVHFPIPGATATLRLLGSPMPGTS